MRRLWLIFSQAVTVSVAVVFVVSTLKPQWIEALPWKQGGPVSLQVATAPPVARTASGAVAAAVGFSEAARLAAPTVVSIVTSKSAARHPQRNDPWFRYFFGDQDNNSPQSGVGSGVIVSGDGYVLTNNHVVEHMDDIEVMLIDGRKARAKVIGTDPESDLAVLKIDLDKLPTITFGDSDTLQVGDAVLAIGNPFGVGQTVTSGIVSALGRNQLGINTFENFIQTDAAINPGNSGGALVDANGHLMGINSAIYSRSGGNMGIGFAIPVSTARQVMESLIRDGQVTRGWIGVEPRDLTPEIAETFNLPVKEGVLITGVLHNGPAATGGVRPGDVVVQVAQAKVANTAQLLNAVAGLKPGAVAQLKVQRGAEILTVNVTVAQRPKMARAEQAQSE
ncbi:MAG TPA: trypsin-like peptidase domain-containing protein [Aquabacterium sp.]|uniref:trypsin-like peptidase domain-containing protein n=1 Tax=Aquabacterium sp. TaxID=1872578 RepID=UPI002E3098C8|nr:trypsin-like peptidase domain-containing protein [Aquabacterium sp.]HEX5372771.1 trypsin-like peptidase domain-containing protein [Aquabacterium sp.]